MQQITKINETDSGVKIEQYLNRTSEHNETPFFKTTFKVFQFIHSYPCVVLPVLTSAHTKKIISGKCC